MNVATSPQVIEPELDETIINIKDQTKNLRKAATESSSDEESICHDNIHSLANLIRDDEKKL